jgi:membrane protease YdiL (CAAX protease family)
MMALIRWCGPLGVVLATLPFVFMHLGKPEIETLSTVFGGIGFGWLAWKTRFVLYGAALHIYILTLVIVAASVGDNRAGSRRASVLFASAERSCTAFT